MHRVLTNHRRDDGDGRELGGGLVLLGFKTELKLNNQQRTVLAQHAGVARHAWNWGLWLTKNILQHNKANPEDKLRFPSSIDLHKLLVAMVKPENPWYYNCSSKAPQYALIALRDAWKRCFTKVCGPPKFKKKGRHNSFTLEGAVKVLGSNKIQVPNIGILKTYERLPQLPIKSCTISRKADRWYISYRLDVEQQQAQHTSTVGIDLGIKTLATLSTGVVVSGPRAYKLHEAKLSRLQYLNRHRVPGSNNYKKALLKVARLHQTIANIRRDTLHKLTSHLAKNHGVVVIEDLNVSGMLKNHKLAKAISDMGFYEFRRQLTYKCRLYGSRLVVADRWYPSSKLCSNCRHKKDTLLLSERTYHCDQCGHTMDRDLNAAINLARTAG